jgi:DNA invertase Pin-like site-specific DNA recombinase
MVATPKKRRRRPKPDMRFTSDVPWKERGDDDPMMIGYVRVSTDDQDTQRQVDELVRAGVNPLDIFGDKASGATMERDGWELCLKNLEAGDVLVIHSLERLSRNTLDTLQTFRELAERGVKVKVLNMDLDTATPIGRFAMTIFAAFGQLERDMAVDRIRSGIAQAKARGVVFGSVRRYTDEAIEAAYKRAGSFEKAAKLLGCSRITIIRGMERVKKAKETT